MMRRLGPALLALLLPACATPVGSSAIELELFEFGVSPSVGAYAPGTVDFHVTNRGEFGHTVVVTSEAGDILFASDIIPPGGDVDIEVELDDGAYQISCRIVTAGEDGTIFDHYEQGMYAKLEQGT